MEIFREEEFYKKEGYPTEYLYYCDYWFIVSDGTPDYGRDYDQFALVKNALYPYIRLTRKRGSCHYPNGGTSIIAMDGSFASGDRGTGSSSRRISLIRFAEWYKE